MANLGSFPAELILEIAENFEGEDSRTMASLCLVSKRFYDTIVPVLYRTISAISDRNIVALILTLYKRPDLAGKVKRLRFKSWMNTEALSRISGEEEQGLSVRESFRAYEPLWTEGLLNYIWSNCPEPNAENNDRERSTDRFRQWIDRMFTGDGCAVSGLLLTLMPNLDGLELNIVEDDWWDLHFNDPLYALYALPDALEVERPRFMAEVALFSSMMAGIRTVKSLHTAGSNLGILNLPFDRLKHLTLDLGQFNGSDSWNKVSHERLYLRYPALESLDIRAEFQDMCGHESGTIVRGLIQSLHCTRLKSFRLKLWGPPEHHDIPSFRGLVLDLETAKMTIENLEIDVVLGPEQYPQCKSFAATPSLRNFSSLRKLEIAQAVIFPHEHKDMKVEATAYPVPLIEIERRLPLSLEELVIHSPAKNILMLLGRIARKRSEFLYLGKVVLICHCEWGMHATFFWSSRPIILDLLRRHNIEVRALGEGLADSHPGEP